MQLARVDVQGVLLYPFGHIFFIFSYGLELLTKLHLDDLCQIGKPFLIEDLVVVRCELPSCRLSESIQKRGVGEILAQLLGTSAERVTFQHTIIGIYRSLRHLRHGFGWE